MSLMKNNTIIQIDKKTIIKSTNSKYFFIYEIIIFILFNTMSILCWLFPG